MAEAFVSKDMRLNLRCINNLVFPETRRGLYNIDTTRFVGKKLWQTLPREVKESQSLASFKRKIKSIKIFDFGCKLCKI